MPGFFEWLMGPQGPRMEPTYSQGDIAMDIERRKLAASQAGDQAELARIAEFEPRLLEGYVRPGSQPAPIAVPATPDKPTGFMEIGAAARQQYRDLNQALKTKPR